MRTIGSEVIGECGEGIRIEAGEDVLRMILVCLEFLVDYLNAMLGLSSGCVDGDGARYRMVICWRMGVGDEIKRPCGCRGFVG